MKRAVAPLAVLVVSSVAFAQDLAWQTDRQAASALAQREGKLVLAFTLVGDLDKPDC